MQMDDMDIDSLMDIPSNPDRLPPQRMNEGRRVGNFYVADHVEDSNSASLDRLRGGGRVVSENGRNRKHYKHPQRLSGGVDEIKHRKNTTVLSPVEEARENAPLSRTTTLESSRNSIREQYIDKGKAPCFKLPSKSFGFGKDHAIVNLTRQNMQKPEMKFPQGGSESFLAEGGRKGNVPRNGGSSTCNSSSNSAIARYSCKGKEKIDDIGFKGAGSVMSHMKGVDLSCGSPLKLKRQLSASHHSDVSPRATEKRRLARNGCIPPQNITIRDKQLNEQMQNNFKSEQNVVSNSPCEDITEIALEDNYGKGVFQPHASIDREISGISLSSSAVSNNGEAGGTNSQSIRDECFEIKGGWRSIHNRSKNVDHAPVHHFSRFKNVGCQVSRQNENKVVKRNGSNRGNNRVLSGCMGNHDETETSPVVFSKSNQISELSLAQNMLPKRQTKHILTSGNSGESSRIIPDDADVVFRGSSRESSSSKSSEMRGTNANYIDYVSNEELEARARQVEADEMLARELQETFEADEMLARELQETFEEDEMLARELQETFEADEMLARELQETFDADEMLAREVQETSYHETDENIARTLQQAEDTFPTSIHNLREDQQTDENIARALQQAEDTFVTFFRSLREDQQWTNMAQELQETSYHETNENIARALQQAEATFPTFLSLREDQHRGSTRQPRTQSSLRTSRNSSNRRGRGSTRQPRTQSSLQTSQNSSNRRGRGSTRQPRTQSSIRTSRNSSNRRGRGSARLSRTRSPLQTSQNTSNMRGVRAHFSTSARVSRSRNQILNQRRAVPSRTRNFHFPLDIDLDMTLDAIQAMEGVIEDNITGGTFQIHDFTDRYYENNHQHTGASTQVNSLPLSEVQTNNSDEVCAICIETPKIGEIVRHLPCLHKFHKDCIDPWLVRETSCPVCKSSIN